ncbi:DUF4058 family protein [Planktothrix sp. FACHB-1355]|uniref:DUF4058 family protein n=1 Tax=Aerosakkonema funiforme FACHB-1375 TaxID=2949571 RepID=A0A926ZGZ5_9CYAN|nr:MULTISPECIES: DUF4058 family protein [Oscillatoriales]MBD2182495.1 DUF4058 family protein [Aerosakkonema funiforme FACHB-1375]MBD3561571.1 DUF4058 family protein [Planktothrix sp. FACHB-1355]
MPSPFPGFDPYLENPSFWPEVHSRLIVALADSLVPQVRPKYEIAIEKRIYEINSSNGDNSILVGVPDLAVKRQSSNINQSPSQIAVAVASSPVQPIAVNVPIPEKIKQNYLEVRDRSTGSVITVIEILSPVNKRAGEGRDSYLQKRQRILGSLTNLVEIDLIRSFQPMPILEADIQSNYRVLISRHTHRPQAELYAFSFKDSLPSFYLPLRSEDIEPTVNLQQLFTEIYDKAGYDYRIDYTAEIVPALSEQDRIWVQELLAKAAE